jgi:hypothetical protein
MSKNKPTTIIIHGTDYSYRKLKDQFLACDGWHKDRYFPKSTLGWFVGYHRLITGGINYKAREDNEVGAHCNQHENGLSMNYQSLGICVGFDGDIEFPTLEDYALLQKQVWEWQDKYQIPPSKIKFHRAYATDKSCPGSLITDQWLKDLLTRPKPVVEKPKEELCTAEVVKKAKWWDNLPIWLKG